MLASTVEWVCGFAYLQSLLLILYWFFICLLVQYGSINALSLLEVLSNISRCTSIYIVFILDMDII